MNCLEFRRHLGSEPASSLEAFVAHRESCPHCAAASGRADVLELRLQKAINVPIPSNLSDRILLAQTTENRQVSRSRRRRRGLGALIVAAAASIVIALVALPNRQHAVPELAKLVVEHMHHHEVGASEAGSEVGDQSVIDAFAARGVALSAVPQGINYVHLCPAGPYRTVHMVMPERSGAVSVFYVADSPSHERIDFDKDGMHGREVPLGQGSLVMLASEDRDFDAIETVWKSALIDGVASASEQAPGAAPGSAATIARLPRAAP
ncbi:DUF3379 family protein [Dokdonella sp.]|uniref:DUF3379 family protein n=1 Tax=Dokdonella sp. TaxID=2291710 RepID=UPI003C327EF0